jgi:hypothetical protein
MICATPSEMKDPIVKLITFGGGSVAYRQAAERLIEQSIDFKSIDERKAYVDADLPPEYFKLFDGLMKNYPTGYGLYSWKPFLIHLELSRLQPNDILIYIDSGCELNNRGIRRFDDYLSHTAKTDVLLFEQQHPNRFWTKKHPMLTGYPEHHFRNQLVGGIIFLKNSQRTKELVKAYLELCSYDKGLLLKDPAEHEPQIPGFIKHRHDQSCLSTCAYLYNVSTLPDETWFRNWSDGANYPILALRNRTGTSKLKQELRKNIFDRLKPHR